MKNTKKMVLGALLTALVIILQYMGTVIRFGPFAISLVLIPIVIGAITCGKSIGAWLGFVFGVVVLLSGDAGVFLAVNIPGTILTVLLKGLACGFFAGLTYEATCKLTGKKYFAAVVAAIFCPVVNTGIFLIGCFAFYMETISGWAAGSGYGADVVKYMLFVLVGGNFVFEMMFNIVFSPAIVHILKAVKKGE